MALVQFSRHVNMPGLRCFTCDAVQKENNVKPRRRMHDQNWRVLALMQPPRECSLVNCNKSWHDWKDTRRANQRMAFIICKAKPKATSVPTVKSMQSFVFQHIPNSLYPTIVCSNGQLINKRLSVLLYSLKKQNAVYLKIKANPISLNGWKDQKLVLKPRAICHSCLCRRNLTSIWKT